MKVGFHTVLWGRRIDDLEYALDVFKACGFKGVEFAQHHKQIFLRKPDGSGIRPIEDVNELLDQLHKRGLSLIGLVGGRISERVEFLRGANDAHATESKEVYLYVDRWPEQEVDEALRAGFTLAIHPHWLMPIRRLRQAIEQIEAFKDGPYAGQVRLLLDTAHAVVAEDDPVKAASRHRTKLAAVHLKSWRPDYGRWSHRYAHGFCLPGKGIVPVKEVMDTLHNAGYGGWIVMEQDHYDQSRELTALEAAMWMRKEGSRWGVAINPDKQAVEALKPRCRINPFFEALGKAGLEQLVVKALQGERPVIEILPPQLTIQALAGPLSELFLGRQLSHEVSRDPNPTKFYSTICQTIRRLLGSRCVDIWSFNPLIGDEGGEFHLVGTDTQQLPAAQRKSAVSAQQSLAGLCFSYPAIWQFDLRHSEVAGSFADQEWLKQIQNVAPWFLILPVFNTSNTHQLRYLITNASEQPLLKPTDFRTFDMAKSMERLGQLEAISWVVAHWADFLTDEACAGASGYTNHLCGNHKQSVTEFMDSLAGYLQEVFKCNQVTVFLEDLTGTRLQPSGKSAGKVDWTVDRQYYSLEDRDTHTWKTWREREMVFSSNADRGRAREKRPPNDDRNQILFAPLASRGGPCHGVVRLHNKERPGDSLSSMFTEDDAAKLDAIIQTALPRLELLILQEQQLQALSRMVHELQTPLVAVRGAVDLMQTDLKRKGEDPAAFFRRDFLDDVLQWTELMGRLTLTARVFAQGGAGQLRTRRTYLLAEVVMPVLRQIRPLVPAGVRFDCHQEDLHTIPQLFLDRHQMQQVFFNLLSNSIKYGGANAIRALITGGSAGRGYALYFQDWGAGIDEHERDRLFNPGFRGRKAALSNISGQGLGLYVVKCIIEAHGGSIKVRSCRNPTTFEITLPESLRFTPPKPSTEDEYHA